MLVGLVLLELVLTFFSVRILLLTVAGSFLVVAFFAIILALLTFLDLGPGFFFSTCFLVSCWPSPFGFTSLSGLEFLFLEPIGRAI